MDRFIHPTPLRTLAVDEFIRTQPRNLVEEDYEEDFDFNPSWDRAPNFLYERIRNLL